MKFASFVQLFIRISGRIFVYPGSRISGNGTGYQKRPDIRYNPCSARIWEWRRRLPGWPCPRVPGISRRPRKPSSTRRHQVRLAANHFTGVYKVPYNLIFFPIYIIGKMILLLFFFFSITFFSQPLFPSFLET